MNGVIRIDHQRQLAIAAEGSATPRSTWHPFPFRWGGTEGRGRGLRLLLLATLAIALLPRPCFADPPPTWKPVDGLLVYTSPKYRFAVDSETGSPELLAIGKQTLATFGMRGWWRATFADGSTVDDFETKASVTQSQSELICDYTHDKLTVRLRITPEFDHIDLRAYIVPKSGTITQFALPLSIYFSTDTLNEVDYPEEIGRALKPAFFAAQPPEYCAWKNVPLGTQGAADVGILPCQMLDYDGPPVPVALANGAGDLLGDEAGRLAGWQVKCPRPPAAPPPSFGSDDRFTSILDTPNGSLLSMETVDGGWGRFIRWGGLLSDAADVHRQLETSTALLQKLWTSNVPNGKSIHPPAGSLYKPLSQTALHQIGIVDLAHNQQSVREWEHSLTPLGCTFQEFHSPDQLKDSLTAHDCWLIVNLDQEVLPSTATDEKSTAAAIRAYIADGGVWLHTGAAPFYYAVDSNPYLSLEGNYPPLFSDFMHIDSQNGQLSLYGVQRPGHSFVPAHLLVEAAGQGGRIGRAWITWVPIGKAWTSPIARIAFGRHAAESVRQYGIANGFKTPLESKIKPDALGTLEQSVLINFSGRSFHDEAAAIAKLPTPSLIHLWDYLHGGFDKQYPDHLPPNPNHGTPTEFAALIDTIHNSGDLFMPYTNPTWWCDDPPSPTLLRDGHAPFLVDAVGNNVRETYGPNWGWALCAFHPDAKAAEASTLASFSKDYPADVLFQDQIGARSPEYDFNAAAPNPDSYTEGMREIAERDSKTLPLGTENGFDAIMDDETMFCGVCWGLVPTEHAPEWNSLWRDRYAPGTWTTTPLALYLAHDKVVFTMHDLGQFVTNRETLAWTIALGYELSDVTNADQVEARPDPWLGWIAALQKMFGPHIIGQPLKSWEEIAPGVFRARYGETTVTSNTTNAPVDIDERTSLPAFGFIADDPVDGIVGGSVTKIDGQAYPGGLDFIDQSGERTTFTPDVIDATRYR